MAVRCAAITKAGSRCQRPVLVGRNHCLMHDPGSADVRLAAARAGGKARSSQQRAIKALPETLTPELLGRHLSGVFLGVIAGTTPAKVGTAAATIARTLADLREAHELEQRIADLERRLDVESGDTDWRSA